MNRRSYRSHELTREERSRGGYARAEKLRERRELVEQIKLERLADRPTPRRRRRGGQRRSAYGLREPFAAAYPVGAPARPVLVAPTRVPPVNEQQALERGLTEEDKPRPFDAGRYEWL